MFINPDYFFIFVTIMLFILSTKLRKIIMNLKVTSSYFASNIMQRHRGNHVFTSRLDQIDELWLG